MTPQPSMASLQEAEYGLGRDYNHGSPHLTHDSLRSRIESDLRRLVRELIASNGQCRVLEVGAGHGSFTSVLVGAGATVTVTEMSEPSARLLRKFFESNERVTVVHDPNADKAEALIKHGCDLIVFISVLHHIPDYVSVVQELVDHLKEGGAFYSTQDPIWYADLTKNTRRAIWMSYMLWRVAQGDLSRGVKTRIRRARGVLDESNPADMVEYHVVRQGVDQKALVGILNENFERVDLSKYWSTQSRLLQRAGERAGLASAFRITARNRRP